ncbi:MAG: MerR family transcriptional regulator [Clostridiales bacterium]|nr:MerR family transcriptional regulator [Clostridiales bacterium]
MLINEVSKSTGLTKKAIEYYTMQELVTPKILENGYRDYSQKDIEVLNKISILRKLDISTEDIKNILSDESGNTLKTLAVRKELSYQREQAKKKILNKLSSGKSYSEVNKELLTVENNKTITEKLLDAFPGYYGRYICLHFSSFLDEPITSDRQQLAYERIISFLDNVPSLELSEELKEYLLEATNDIGTEQITDLIKNMKKTIESPEDFLSSNKEVLEQYLAYRKSDDYKNSPIGKIMELTKEFNRANGYYDIFIPAMKELSSSYSEYYNQLEETNRKLLEQYPSVN